jgi:predicted XRE-type DNA-binding protein
VNIERGSSNVYADLGLADAQDMLIKAKLATEINRIIRQSKLTQVEVAKILGMTQPKLSGMLRGQFRGISEIKMIECLNHLGRDVDIVVKPTPETRREGFVSVVFV